MLAQQGSLFSGFIAQEFDGTGRAINDYYPTPAGLTKALLKVCKIPDPIFEPFAGERAICTVLYNHGHRGIVSSDIAWDNPSHLPQDATTEEFWDYYCHTKEIRSVVTNPPFNLASQVLPLAFAKFDFVAFLLRLSYQEPCEDRSFWLERYSDHLKFQLTFNPRPKFRRDSTGGDNVTCAWLVWDKTWSWSRMGIDCPFKYSFDWKIQ